MEIYVVRRPARHLLMAYIAVPLVSNSTFQYVARKFISFLVKIVEFPPRIVERELSNLLLGKLRQSPNQLAG